VNCKSDIVVTADAGVRGGRVVPLKPIIDTAVVNAEKRGVTVRKVLVHHRAGEGAHEGTPGWVKGRDYSLDQQISEVFRNTIGRGDSSVSFKPAIMNAEDPLFILYTSGSTGTPKGVLHTTGGYMVYAATTFKHIFDTRPSAAHYPKLKEAENSSLNVPPNGIAEPSKDGSPYKSGTPGAEFYNLSRSGKDSVSSAQAGQELRAKSREVVSPDLHFCTADVGWVTGHSYITYGPLLNGTHTLMFEGVPTYPGPDRFWQVAAKHKATTLYTAPTAIRALMVHGNEPVEKHDLSSLRILGSVGEPINAEAWRWFHSVVGKGKCSLVDTWWQTECGGISEFKKTSLVQG
jgi:acyl-coenzyme A synthetase/AMP-(fatty) acid ligase